MSDDEWKAGYRDGLSACITVVETVADDGGTAGDAVELLTLLVNSHVLDPKEGPPDERV